MQNEEAKIIKIFLKDEVNAHDGLQIKQRNKTGKVIKKVFSRWKKSGDSKYPEGVHEEMVIDKSNDHYTHKVIDEKTSSVIHQEDISLTEHNAKGGRENDRLL